MFSLTILTTGEYQMTFKIEKGVPLPPKRSRGKTMYPFGQMEVGDSFAIPHKKFASAYKSLQNVPDYKGWFASRKLDDGTVRFWRIA